MCFHLGATNLFRYATSELSQDAFICWLLSHLTPEGWDADPQVRACAADFMDRVLWNSRQLRYRPGWRIQDIRRQYDKIDVLIVLNQYRIILEDKVATGTRRNQIAGYQKALLASEPGLAQKNILTVYYKIIDQPGPEPGVDCEFTRGDLLALFRPYGGRIANPIFCDYLEYLEWIEARTNSWQTLPIADWSPQAYIGFFKHLQQALQAAPAPLECSWGYVSNPSGGFMGLWLGGLFSSGELDAMGLTQDVCDNLYIQFENDIIAVKYSVDPQNNPDRDRSARARRALYEYLGRRLGGEWEKKVFRYGTFMTVGYIRYNESNYRQQLDKILDALQSLKEAGALL